jgi:glutamine amidotransferase
MIAVIDYGMGNLRSVVKGFEKVGVRAEVTGDPDVVIAADGIVLPGVGAFGMAMEHLRRSGLDEAVKTAVAARTPFLGICLGLQLLFTESDEFGPVRGLDIIPGRVVRFFPEGAPAGIKIPHMGWNSLQRHTPSPVLADIPDGTHVYFVHSYYVVPDDPAVIAATTEYGGQPFAAAVTQGPLFACQFHPEKSSELGLRMLRNFGMLVQQSSRATPA